MNAKNGLANYRKYQATFIQLGDRNAIFGQYTINFVFQVHGVRPDEAANRLAPVENHQGRNGLNRELTGGFGVLVDVHFGEAQFALVFVAQALEDWCNGATGTAPRGPEIDDDGFVGFEYLLLKILVTHMEKVAMSSHMILSLTFKRCLFVFNVQVCCLEHFCLWVRTHKSSHLFPTACRIYSDTPLSPPADH